VLATLILFVGGTAKAQQDVVPGQFIIKYRDNLPAGDRFRIAGDIGLQPVQQLDLIGAQVMQSYGDGFNESLAKELLASGEVEYIEPNYIYHINTNPNDSSYSQLWGVNNSGQTGGTSDVDIDAPEAWDIETGSNTIVVGVVDTGIDYSHPDIAANMWVNTGEIAGNGIDDDGNGYIDDLHGMNAVNDGGNPYDDNSHGTHVAGTIGGVGNNGTGVAGVNWNVKLMGLKFLNGSGSGSTSDAIEAIEYAVLMKQRGVNIKVLNNSWGGGGFSFPLEAAIQAANDAGILFVVAAGNSSNNNDVSPTYPANYDIANVMSVAAIDHNGNLASFSNYGETTVDLAAPGVNILSTVPGGGYQVFSGTSMASPHVAGVAALVLAQYPSLSVADLRYRLQQTVKPLVQLQGLMAHAGTVSALNSLTNEVPPAPPQPAQVSYKKTSATYLFDADLGTRIMFSDDQYTAVNLDFDFNYYGDTFRRLAVSTNGRIVPLADNASLPSGSDFSNQLRDGIHVFADDLYPALSGLAPNGGVWAKLDASGVTISWVMVNYRNRFSQDANVVLSFQAKLLRTGEIQFHYLDTYAGDSVVDYGNSATVGLSPHNGGNGVKLLVSNNTSNPAEIGSGKALRFSVNSSVKNDFDGDGKSDLVVYRPSFGMWYILESSSNNAQHRIYQWGLPGDIPVVGDYDGDNRDDLAVWRPHEGNWYINYSSFNFQVAGVIQWGLFGDVPVPADYDGDGKTDLAVYRKSIGTFYTLTSSAGFNRDQALTGLAADAMIARQLGDANHTPLIGDFDGDAKDDFNVAWNLNPFWTSVSPDGPVTTIGLWGFAGDELKACDLDGDKRTDRVAIRNEGGLLTWYVSYAAGGADVIRFGLAGDHTNCHLDTDGDGTSEIRVWRPGNGTWYTRTGESPLDYTAQQWGLPGDIPL